MQHDLTHITSELECGNVAFVDIETTGLSKEYHDITLIGIFDGEEVHQFIQGKNLEAAKDKLAEFSTIVTFNGKTFDVPFIEHKLETCCNHLHFDLRYMLKEFGLSGGLKKIEKELGLVRGEDIAHIDGFFAVRLWHDYKAGDLSALELLLKYNKEDIVNLKTLLNWYLNKKR
jgi:uncharacterized protein YprB with RNaseH-like and TPR domain